MLVSKLLAATMIAGPADSPEAPARQGEEPPGVATTPGSRMMRGTKGTLRSRGIVGLAVRRRGPVRLRHISK
jgi:hypothetical protein